MYLDVVGNNGDIFKVKCCIDFVHDIEWGWLVMVQGKHLTENKQMWSSILKHENR